MRKLAAFPLPPLSLCSSCRSYTPPSSKISTGCTECSYVKDPSADYSRIRNGLNHFAVKTRRVLDEAVRPLPVVASYGEPAQLLTLLGSVCAQSALE